jgi:hypothetical protein
LPTTAASLTSATFKLAERLVSCPLPARGEGQYRYTKMKSALMTKA